MSTCLGMTLCEWMMSCVPFSLPQYALHVTLASECMQKYRGGVNPLCIVEQDMALGTNAQGERISDPLKEVMPVLFDRQIQ